MTFELLENTRVENWGTYGIVGRIRVARPIARSSHSLLSGLVLLRRDGEELGIDTLDAIWEKHDGRIYA